MEDDILCCTSSVLMSGHSSLSTRRGLDTSAACNIFSDATQGSPSPTALGQLPCDSSTTRCRLGGWSAWASSYPLVSGARLHRYTLKAATDSSDVGLWCRNAEGDEFWRQTTSILGLSPDSESVGRSGGQCKVSSSTRVVMTASKVGLVLSLPVIGRQDAAGRSVTGRKPGRWYQE